MIDQDAADTAPVTQRTDWASYLGRLVGGRYRIVRFIAGGGMGRVYEALDTRLAEKVVALKVLVQHLFAEDERAFEMLLQRFEQEARLSALLGRHPCIIQVTDYGIEDSRPYLAMEYLGKAPEGRSLTQLIEQEGALAPERVVALAAQICDGLAYAHNLRVQVEGQTIRGVIHRDVKPNNIFVLQRGELGETIKILDFGIAKAVSDASIALGTNTGFVGTPKYAAPEQLRGDPPDARSDIYSLGVVLYQMLTGRLPLQPKTDSFPGWYQYHNYEQPIGFEGTAVPTALAAVVLSCLAKKPEERPQTMQELAQRLQVALNTPDPLPRRPVLGWFAAASLVALLVAAGTGLIWQQHDPTKPSPVAATAPVLQTPPPKRPSSPPTRRARPTAAGPTPAAQPPRRSTSEPAASPSVAKRQPAATKPPPARLPVLSEPPPAPSPPVVRQVPEPLPRLYAVALGTGSTARNEIRGETNTFAPDTPEIYCVWKANVRTSTELRIVWVADETGEKLAEDGMPLSGAMSGTFNLSKPEDGWTAGRYHLELYLGEVLAQSVPFTVR
ncbi:serine/threonine-protein kinase [Gloeobacter kilaueensis]|uniref:Serine/threonine protein kinase n=1 Tax=Gloeobacter kilaueensis (strain ATCC BAA-2537 / CCAP 1431/1 / ULC 316 / JS1) TaxID=1183438 RepID=U5QNW3_GLOK1|nr:serine/threonine-protein kinase [Gloeobacter kilaueensis]AGY59320.1 serine/threonine protein kinase [Gloeobacter kilaueensis JS1]